GKSGVAAPGGTSTWSIYDHVVENIAGPAALRERTALAAGAGAVAPRPRAPGARSCDVSSRIVMNVGMASSAAPARVSPRSTLSYTPGTSDTFRFIHCTGAVPAL